MRCSVALHRHLGLLHRLHSSAGPELKAPLAFVFDIDGVLIRGGRVLPEAKQALAALYEQGPKPLFPTCFLTNSGGVTEEHKAQELSEWLDVPVHSSQVVLSHTPFRELAQHYRDKPVLIAGRKATADVARHYGYRKALTTDQLAEAFPHAVPFSLSSRKRTSQQAQDALQDVGSESRPFEAVMVYTDPHDWYTDLQLIHDIITSGGVMGRSPAAEHAGRVPVYFSNPDLLWANEFSSPRFGQGALQIALKALHQEVMGVPLANYRVFGKPHEEAYRLTEALLRQQTKKEGTQQDPGFGSIVAIGDNPESDIAGANAAGRPWVSMLVRSGVFQGSANSNRHAADYVIDNVMDAVQLALARASQQ